MPLYLIKNKSGLYSPSDEESQTASKKLAIGSEVKATQARNVGHHRKAFALLNMGFDNQDRYTSLELYRKIITIKAGYFDMVDGKEGKTYYIPKSISFEAMNQIDFQKCYDAMLEVIAKEMQTAPEQIQAELNSFF